MIKAVIFDFDGTIVNSLPYYIKVYDLTYRTFGFQLSRKQIIQNFSKKITTICQELRISEKTSSFLETYKTNVYKLFINVQFFPDFLAIYDYLKLKDIKVALASFAFREYIDFMLKKMELIGKFNLVLAFEDVQEAKPAPEAVLKICQKLKIKPQESLVVGDSRSDMLMGKSAGAKTAWFCPTENLRIYDQGYRSRIRSDYQITDLIQIKDLII